MKLIEIDKKTYRNRLNIVIVSFISCLLALALIYGQLLIAGFGVEVPTHHNDAVELSENHDGAKSNVSQANEEQPTNFKYNFLGVLLSLLSCIFILHRLRESEFFYEVYYVWQVKQLQNLIFRKLKKIKAGAENGDVNALIILNFYYASLKQIYLLDDNTLTISKLNRDIEQLNELISSKNLTLSDEQFEKSMVTSYN